MYLRSVTHTCVFEVKVTHTCILEVKVTHTCILEVGVTREERLPQILGTFQVLQDTSHLDRRVPSLADPVELSLCRPGVRQNQVSCEDVLTTNTKNTNQTLMNNNKNNNKIQYLYSAIITRCSMALYSTIIIIVIINLQ